VLAEYLNEKNISPKVWAVGGSIYIEPSCSTSDKRNYIFQHTHDENVARPYPKDSVSYHPSKGPNPGSSDLRLAFAIDDDEPQEESADPEKDVD
jgi:hypothetical protein